MKKKRSVPANPRRASSDCSTADVARDLDCAIDLLDGEHVTRNRHRLGALGSGDLDLVRQYIRDAQLKLSNAELSEPRGRGERSKPK